MSSPNIPAGDSPPEVIPGVLLTFAPGHELVKAEFGRFIRRTENTSLTTGEGKACLSLTKGFAEGYEAIFGKKEAIAGNPELN